MRILAAAFDYAPMGGGVARLAREVSAALARRSETELRLLAPSREGDAAADAAAGLDVRRVRLPRDAAAAVVPLTAALARECLDWRPDAILSFLWLPCGAAAWLAGPARRGGKGIPHFVYVHGVELIEARSTLRKRVRGLLAPAKRAILRSAEGVFANSRYTGALAAEAGADPARVKVVPPGVDPGRFSPGPPDPALLARLGLEGRAVALTVARLVPHKGIDRAIGAFARVAGLDPGAVYVVAGDGPDRARLEGIAREAGLDGRVRFTGAVAEADLAALYRSARVLVSLSREDREAPAVEGFGIAILEAAACGVPALGGRSGGVPEAIEDGHTGWLVDPADEEGAARVLARVLAEPSEAARRGEAARARAIEGFTWRECAELIAREMAGHGRG